MEKSNDGQVPDAAVEIYQMTREDLDDLLDQAREEAVLAINAMSQSSHSPPVSTGLGTSSMNLVQSVPSNSATSAGICTPPVSSGLGVMALNPGLPVTSGASRPAFKKAGLSRQYEFNAGLVAALASIAEIAPESVKASLVQVITQLSQRNELLVIADTDPDVFEFYDQHSRAETLQSSNPILAAFLRERKKKESKKPAPRSTMWTPMVFTKIMRPLLYKWRMQGINVAIYLDDGLIWANSARGCEESIESVRSDLRDAGFLLAEEKCSWSPLQKLTWLGHEINLEEFTLNVTKSREMHLSLEQAPFYVWITIPKSFARPICPGYLVGESSTARELFAVLQGWFSPDALAKDAFSSEARQWWSSEFLWWVPPPNLILRTIRTALDSGVPSSPRGRRAAEVAALASNLGLPSIANIVHSCFDSSVSRGTLAAYKKIRKDFMEFLQKSNVPASAIHKLRNLYLASLIDKGKLKSLEVHAAALGHFFGPLPEVDQDIQRALLRSAARVRPPVVHRAKASPEDSF
ncbi:hypothetical protein COOONC_01275 [Cooperia oncophora]